MFYNLGPPLQVLFKFCNEASFPNLQRMSQINKSLFTKFLNKKVVFNLPDFVIKVVNLLKKMLLNKKGISITTLICIIQQSTL